MGMTSRGTGTRLMRPALSTRDVVPLSQPTEKKLKGTSPQNRKTAKCGICDAMILVKTNVSTPIMTKGFSIDQNTPSDMFR